MPGGGWRCCCCCRLSKRRSSGGQGLRKLDNADDLAGELSCLERAGATDATVGVAAAAVADITAAATSGKTVAVIFEFREAHVLEKVQLMV